MLKKEVEQAISNLQGKERGPVWMVGEQLKDMIRDDEQAQEIVLQDLSVKEMSLAACEKKIKAYADKHKTGSFACVTPVEAERIIREFYGLQAADRRPKAEGETRGSRPEGTEDNILRLEDFF